MATVANLTQRTLAMEMQPQNGDINALFILGGLVLLHNATGTLESAAVFARPGVLDGLPHVGAGILKWGVFGKIGAGPALMILLASDFAIVAGITVGVRFAPAAGLGDGAGFDDLYVHHQRCREPLDL